jgi:hypothetical protein
MAVVELRPFFGVGALAAAESCCVVIAAVVVRWVTSVVLVDGQSPSPGWQSSGSTHALPFFTDAT